MIAKHSAIPPKGAFCFGCNQSFDGGTPAVRFESDLVPTSDRSELSNLYFHAGHVIRYARRRDWTTFADEIERSGAAHF